MGQLTERWLALTHAASTHGLGRVLDVVRDIAIDNFGYELLSDDQIGDFLELALKLEGGRGDNTGEIRGLYQFSRLAWKEAGFGSWEENVMDPMHSTRAAIKYYLINKRRFERSFPRYAYTTAIAYLYHNQGPTGAKYYLANLPDHVLLYGGQSTAATALFKSIKLE